LLTFLVALVFSCRYFSWLNEHVCLIGSFGASTTSLFRLA